VDNFAGQLEAAAEAVEDVELLDEELELELELSDLAESDFFSEPLDDDSDEVFDEPLDELLEDSRLSVR
jgi:hypothetical protein